MPFSDSSDSSLPKHVKSMSPTKRRQWVAVFNSAFSKCQKEGGSNCDGIAMRTANGVAKKASYVRLFAKESKGRAFVQFVAGEPPQTINIFPIPGTYKHPQWGNMVITKEDNQEFVDNFNKRIYQKHVPLDAEHETKMSGAVAYFEELMMNDDGSVDARMDWTPRGVKLLEDDAFRFISPEWYEQWTDPATQEDFDNVLIGGALTTRPFFKGLRSLLASENGMYDTGDDGDGEAPIELVDEELHEAVFNHARSEFPALFGDNSSVVSMHDDHIVIDNGAGTYFRLEFEMDESDVTITQTPTEAVWATVHPSGHRKEKKNKHKVKFSNDRRREDTMADIEEIVKAAEGIEDDEEKKSWLSKIASALGINVTVTQDDDDPDDDPDDDADADNKGKGKKASEEVLSLKAQLDASEKSLKANEERLGNLEAASRKARYRDIILGRDEASSKKAKEEGAKALHPMVGDLEGKMTIMESLEEGSKAFEAFVASERDSANRLHETDAFKEIGINSTDGNVDSSAKSEFATLVKEAREKDGKLSEPEAVVMVAKENPNLYEKYDKEATGRTRKWD